MPPVAPPATSEVEGGGERKGGGGHFRPRWMVAIDSAGLPLFRACLDIILSTKHGNVEALEESGVAIN